MNKTTYSVAAYFAAVTTKYCHTEAKTVILARNKTIEQARELVRSLYAKNTRAVGKLLNITIEQAAQLQGASRYFIPENEEQ